MESNLLSSLWSKTKATFSDFLLRVSMLLLPILSRNHSAPWIFKMLRLPSETLLAMVREETLRGSKKQTISSGSGDVE